MTDTVAAPGADRAPHAHDMASGVGKDFPEQVRRELADFLTARADEITEQGVEVHEWVELASQFLQRGKCLRPRFAYLGWLSRAEGSTAALRAAASFELLHAFALIQDDVMDESDQRRGMPALHRTLNHTARPPGHGQRFGESAATLLADLCLVWSAQMLRTCGLPAAALNRAFPYYDGMRQELAVGQYLDLRTTHRAQPGSAHLEQVARMKSARYTVTGPLVVGARLAGAEPAVRSGLSDFGDAIGDAFQMRDDLLGVFGDPAVTGKPADDDLARGKLTTVTAQAFERAAPAQRQALHELFDERSPRTEDLARLRELIVDTGAASAVEAKITERVALGMHALHKVALSEASRTELAAMARSCATRSS